MTKSRNYRKRTNPDRYSVYIMINKRSGRVYIGMTGQPILIRNRAHISKLKTGKHRNPDLQADFNRGDRFSFSVIAKKLTYKVAAELELNQIMLHKSHDSNYGYNLKIGLGHGVNDSDTLETKGTATYNPLRSGKNKLGLDIDDI